MSDGHTCRHWLARLECVIFFLSVFESQRFFGRPFGCGCAAVDETTSVVHVFEALRTNVEPTI